MPRDRRAENRRSLDRPCWIDDGRTPKTCRLHNVSKSGAKMTCDTPEKIPTEFFLYLTRDGKVGRRCEVVRREGAVLGLRFAKARRIPKPKWADEDPTAGLDI